MASMGGAHYEDFTWRVGRKVGRTIYAVVGKQMANDSDVLVGVMDTPELAAAAVEAHNQAVNG